MKYQEDIKEHCYVVKAPLPQVVRYYRNSTYGYNTFDSSPQKTWCDLNCNGVYSFENFIDFGLWFFVNKTDAMRFKLTWT